MANQAIKLYRVDDTDKRVGINLPEGTNPSYSLYVSGSLRVTTVSRFDGKMTIPLVDSTYGEASSKAQIQFVAPTTASPFIPAFKLPSKVGSWAIATYPGSGELFYFVYNDGSGTSNANTKRYYLDPSKGNADTTNRIFTTAETIGIGNGGTGSTTALGAANNILTGLPAWTANPTDNTYFIRQDTGGANSFGKVPFTTLYNYIKGKTDTLYLPLAGGMATGDLGSNTWLISNNTTLNGSGVRMRFSDKSSADYVLMFASREANYGGRLTFREWSENSSGAHLGYYENFRLPRPDQGRTTNATYDILTTKGVTMTGYFMLQNSAQYPTLRFKPSHSTSNGNNVFGPASIWINAGSTTNITYNKMYFRLYSPTASSGSTTYTEHYEQFELPSTNVGRTNDAGYAILTSKSAVTIAQGGTGSTTRLGALEALTSEAVGTSTEFFLTITRNWTKGGYCNVADAKTVLGITGTQYGSNQMGWKKVSITLTNGAGSVACTGVTADSVVQATRVGTYSDTSGGYSTHIGAAASNAGNVKVFSTASGTVTWSTYLWWSKTATGG